MNQEDVDELERELARLGAQWEAELKAHLAGLPNQWIENRNAILAVERRLASIRGEEFAEPLDSELNVRLGSHWRAIGGFGEDATLVCELIDSPGSAVITFANTMAMKLGQLNDEVLEGHPLHGKGLEVVGAFVVCNSRWAEEFRAAMQLHPQYDAELWSRVKHFMFRDKEGDFECLATGFEMKVSESRVKVRLSARDEDEAEKAVAVTVHAELAPGLPMGASREQIVAEFGKPQDTGKGINGATLLAYFDKTVQLTLRDGRLFLLAFYYRVTHAPTKWPQRFDSLKGFSADTKPGEVEVWLGMRHTPSTRTLVAGNEVITTSDGARFCFEDGRLDSIQIVSQLPESAL